MLFQVVQHVLIDPQRVDDDAVSGELDEVKAAEGGGVLVLATAADPQVCPFHGVGELGDFVLVQASARHLRQGADDGYRHRGRATHSAAGRGVALKVEVKAARAS